MAGYDFGQRPNGFPERRCRLVMVPLDLDADEEAPYARRGSKTATFHESAVVRLMRSIVATPTLKSRAMARMDFPSLSMALT